MPPLSHFPVYLELGAQKVVAAAVDYPGWCRVSRSEPSALAALADYAPRYASLLHAAGLDFSPPSDVSAFTIVERLRGNSATDFGVPGNIPACDHAPLDPPEFARLTAILQACWQAFDRAARATLGTELRKGPRGGGRAWEAVLRHTLEAEISYLASLGVKYRSPAGVDLPVALQDLRPAVLAGLAASARSEISPLGPRGGQRWSPRYFIRRAAWHLLDHAWELEDRSQPSLTGA